MMNGPEVVSPGDSPDPRSSPGGSVSQSTGTRAGLSGLRSVPQPVPAEFDFRSVSMFLTLGDKEVATLRRSSTLVSFAARIPLGNQKGSTLLILSGEVECLLPDAAGKPFLLSVQGKGSSLGELSFLVPDQANDHKITLRAQSDVQALLIPNQVFDEVVHGNPHSSREFSRQLAERLKSMNAFAKTAVDVRLDPDLVEPETLADRSAAKLTRGVGSWRFVGASLVLIGVWMGINALPHMRFDAPPYVGLNGVFSLMSALTGSIILIAQNYRNKLDASVVRVIQRVTIGVAAKVDQLLKSQTRTNKRLDAIEAALRKKGPTSQGPMEPPKEPDNTQG